MDTEPTLEAEALTQSKKQTEALESLRTIAVVWSFVAVFGALIWLIASIVGA